MYLFVALGGALGSGLRYFLSNKINSGGDFPLATLIINVVGAFFLAIIAFYAEKNKLDPRFILFLKVGFCGGFTTFSTFAFEIFNLEKNGNLNFSIFYALISIILSLLGIYFARFLILEKF